MIESIADQHKYIFHKRSQNNPRSSAFLRTGLWSISRHPNYFGEILLWFGIWLSSSYGLWSVNLAAAILGLASPILAFFLLVFVSGIPIAEKREEQMNRGIVLYKEYRHRTSPLIPFPPSLYEKTLWPIKKWIFFDRSIPSDVSPTKSGNKSSKSASR